MKFDDLLRSLAQTLGGGIDLEPDDSGVVTLGIDDMPVMIVNLEELSAVILHASVALPPPEEHVERLYRVLLASNHDASRKGGSVFSISHESGEIFLSRALPAATLDGACLKGALAEFFDELASWRTRIRDFRGETPGDEGDAGASDIGFGDFLKV